MAKKTLSSSVLLALGLTEMVTTQTACGPCLDVGLKDTADTSAQACLSIDPDTGPCLEFVGNTAHTADTDDTGFGPCLDIPADTTDTTDTGPDSDTDTGISVCLDVRPSELPIRPPIIQKTPFDDVVDKVVESGVLPEDVAALVRRRKP